MWKKFIEWRVSNDIDNAAVTHCRYIEILFAVDTPSEEGVPAWIS